ncbi:MAG: bifunctional folylpolyglutamate synthase/dihydrofolate synthase [Bacteroidetes bacterium]|nr:MAG: bifunctional folylpolyglutamate synthase/dihydrofolate synthase [Bacteroidota bacterium]
MLNNPQHAFKSVHISGTNGKGSTSHMLAAVLQKAGYKVGLYTSPHLKDFRERIRINGVMIEEQAVQDFVEQYKPHFDEIKPSFFEWTVALCFDYFAKQQVDIAIIETGLGGRLDSTNVINPVLSIITNIGWDHMDMLGDTLPKIAVEKAGIIKHGVPVVIGEYHLETFPVFIETAKKQVANLVLAGDLVHLQQLTFNNNELQTNVFIKGEPYLEQLSCDLSGFYQQHNIKTVIASLLQLVELGFDISPMHMKQGLAQVKAITGLAGRWHVLQQQPLVIADTGHNVNGIEWVIEQLQQQSYHNLHMVIGMVKDKDISKVLALLPTDAAYYFTQAAIPRALPAYELKTLAETFGLSGGVYADVLSAKQAAINTATPEDLIFIGGSTFIVAEAL